MIKCCISLKVALYILTVCFIQSCAPSKDEKPPTLFTLLPSDSTNITFVNQIVEDENVNPLQYENSYNGGGVAIGDVNNDGLDDIYFTGNRSGNKLYINRGNFKFEDVTDKASCAGRKSWTTGTTMVDINADGLLDIYVCHSGNLQGYARANELFINKGIDKKGMPSFVDEAKKYGLADSAFSIQASFFDYDLDGDLDMILLNHSPVRFNNLDKTAIEYLLNKTDSLTGLKLYRNDNNIFKEVTAQSGMRNSRLNFNLGVAVSDINNDGYPDVYVSNDYLAPDYLYINQKNGTFKDELGNMLSATSEFSMGNDVADINNDGLPDIFTLDMLPEDNKRQKLLFSSTSYELFKQNEQAGLHAQYMRNMLQLNNGNGTFSEIGQLAGVSNTDWSWASLIADFDNDGWKDIFVSNGYLRDYTNLDFLKYMGAYLNENKGLIQKSNLLELVKKMPVSEVSNYVFQNNHRLQFNNKSKEWGLDAVSNSSGTAYADFDNDGDLDLVVNNINKPAFVYRNNEEETSKTGFIKIKLQGEGSNPFGVGAKAELYVDGIKQVLEQQPTRGFQSSVSPVLFFGLGKATHIDSLIINWPGNKKQILKNVSINQQLVVKEAEAAATKNQQQYSVEPILIPISNSPINYIHHQQEINDYKRQPLLINPLSYVGPCMAKGDVNGDGKEDIFIGGSVGFPASVYIQKNNRQFEKLSEPAFDADEKYNDACAVLFDANNDGSIDLCVAAGGYYGPGLQTRLYINDTHGKFTLAANAMPAISVSAGAIAAGDINSDGFPDLFIGARVVPGSYPETPTSYILLNDGKGNFRDATKETAPSLSKAGMFTSAVFADMDGDKRNELITAGDWMPLQVWKSINGKLEDATAKFIDSSEHGWWNTLAVKDVNADGKPDIVAGNYGLNCQWKASSRQPVEIYYKDFDGNGTVDPVFCYYIQGKSYPYVSRDELVQHINMMRTRFTDYKSYADADINSVFTKEELNNANRLFATNLQSTIFISNAAGKLEAHPLPIEAQFSPVFAIAASDFNSDGKMDLILGGNINSSKLKIGANESNKGQLFLGDGHGNFSYVNQTISGLNIQGETRSFCTINDLLFVGASGQAVQAYKMKK